ncbi:uncharacterized protein H6S33_012876 [Morchella sextelata]|uniref:uncharacterized protein n=1 Tax=Morchella sextelata TaxID=1174677 RepID=UPI001D052825|nr:uncharacterized protein H6S33_012876 [Morchella sextelata]KAH0609390.1 hypothetical protein H6S33_012876 [Morchella sextelata]
MAVSSALDTDLPRNVYLLWKAFMMPTDKGGKLAISVDDSTGAYFLSAYTIILGSMFGFFWQFITYLIITWYPTENDSRVWSRKDRNDFKKDGTGSKPLLPDQLLEVRRNKANRYIALVSIWNTTDPASAMLLLMEHAWIMCKTVGDQATCMLDVMVLLLTAGFMISAGAARVLIASTLFIGNESPMGNVAPVNPSNVFYWLPGTTRPMIIEAFTFGVSSSQRAAGAIESISDETRQKVSIVHDKQSISYNYTITGVEFGLQHASYLTFPVRGKCELISDYIDTLTDPDNDIYYYPYLPNNVSIPARLSLRAPVVAADWARDHKTGTLTGNSSYILLFETVMQQSFYNTTDPVYETELVDADPNSPHYRIKRGRPFLHCYEQSYWAYKDIKIYNPQNIDQLPNSVVPGALRDELIPFHFSQSRFPNLVRTLGGAVLVSSSSSYGGVIDAASASWHKDMERLIYVNYVSSRNAFRDSASLTTLLKERPDRNAATENGVPKQGLGDIVVGTSKVTTMSIVVLIVIPVAWIFVWCIITIFRCNRCTSRNSGKASRFTLRAVGLQATQMYRLLDEEVCGDRDDWQGRKTHMPYILKAKGPKSPNPMASPVSSDTITNSPSPQLNPPIPLFAAPKVVKDEKDQRYHLKFTGPLNYEAKVDKKERLWKWKYVAGEPLEEARTPKDKVSKLAQNFDDKGLTR